jgi:hypothetical protein
VTRPWLCRQGAECWHRGAGDDRHCASVRAVTYAAGAGDGAHDGLWSSPIGRARQDVQMEPVPLSKGWHSDPSAAGRFRYWDGREWSGSRQKGPHGGWTGHWSLRGWRRIWYGRVLRMPFIFYPLPWFNCSIPVTRGRLNRVMYSPQARRT